MASEVLFLTEKIDIFRAHQGGALRSTIFPGLVNAEYLREIWGESNFLLALDLGVLREPVRVISL